MQIVESEYKGHPMLVFNDDFNKFCFSIGLWKAKIIVDNIEIVKRFIGDVDE